MTYNPEMLGLESGEERPLHPSTLRGLDGDHTIEGERLRRTGNHIEWQATCSCGWVSGLVMCPAEMDEFLAFEIIASKHPR